MDSSAHTAISSRTCTGLRDEEREVSPTEELGG